MEEDIKILENILKTKEYGLCETTDTFYTALENLLTRYKQLEKENEEWQRAYQEEKDKQFELLRENKELEEERDNCKGCFIVSMENSIPKSELKNDLKHMKNAKATGVKQLLMKKGIIGYLEKLLGG